MCANTTADASERHAGAWGFGVFWGSMLHLAALRAVVAQTTEVFNRLKGGDHRAELTLPFVLAGHVERKIVKWRLGCRDVLENRSTETKMWRNWQADQQPKLNDGGRRGRGHSGRTRAETRSRKDSTQPHRAYTEGKRPAAVDEACMDESCEGTDLTVRAGHFGQQCALHQTSKRGEKLPAGRGQISGLAPQLKLFLHPHLQNVQQLLRVLLLVSTKRSVEPPDRAQNLKKEGKKKRRLDTPTDRKRHSALDEHGCPVEHITRRA